MPVRQVAAADEHDPAAGTPAASTPAPAILPPAGATVAPEPRSPAGLLALQQGAGNAAVARMLAARTKTLQRDDLDPGGGGATTSAPPPKPLANGFEWTGSTQAPQLLVDRAHLERLGVPRGATVLRAASNRKLFEPIAAALLDLYPWTAPRRADILAKLEFSITIGEDSWQQPQFRVMLDRTVFKVIGLPPDAPMQVYFDGTGVEIYVDLVTVNPAGGDPGPELPERILQKLEEVVRLPIPTVRRPVIAASLRQYLTPLSGVVDVPLPEAWMLEVFGEREWRERMEAISEDGEEGTVLAGLAGTFELSPMLTPEDAKFVQETIIKLFGKAQGGKPPTTPLRIFTTDVEALRRIAKDPERLERLASLLYFAGDGSVRYTSFANLLEAADEALDVQEHARRLGVRIGKEKRDAEPIVRRPVRGDIVNKTGELVPGQKAKFEFETRDQVGEFRVPWVTVRWEAVAKGKGGARIDGDTDKYIEIRPDGILNDRVFDVAFPRKGVYEVHAFVDHNFFLPAHFVTPVEVRTEQERLKSMDERSGFGAVTGTAPKRFKDVDDEDQQVAVAAGLGGVPLAGLPANLKGGYAEGRRTSGVIDPDVMGVAGGGLAIGLSRLDEEIRQVEQLRKDTETAGGSDKAAMLKWVDDRLEGLRKTQKQLTEAKGAPGTHSVLTQGSYVARTNKARGGPLSLISWFTQDAATGEYHVHLLDHSQLVRAEDFHFEAEGKNYEQVMERLFFELTKTYPDGSMTFAFQAYDGLTPTARFVRFERKTDTTLNDVRDVVFSEEASIAVNIISLLLTIFPPTTALGITLGVAYNTAQALDSYSEAERTGTLKTQHKIELALAALSVLPAARGTRMVRLGARTYQVINVVERAGDVFLLAMTAEGEIRNLRNGLISDLARVQDEIVRTKRINASDPKLRDLEHHADQLRDEIRSAATTVLDQMAKSMLLQMAPGMAIDAFAHRRGAADPDADEPTRRPPIPDDPGGTPPPKPGRDALGDPVLAEGLPPGLRKEVAVLRDESVHDNAVRVHYELDDSGLVRSVTVKAGRAATPDDVRLHARTAELMLGYRGLSGSVRVLLEKVKAYFLGSGTPPPVGSRAWEAKLELDKLPGVIRQRAQALEKGVDVGTATKLRAEIEFLSEQLARHAETFRRLDTEAGAGFVAAEADHHAKAVAAGFPSLERAEGHYYEPDGKGGYSLRQRADSAARPMELAEEGGRRTLREGKREAIPGLELGQAELRRVLEVMSAGQASAMAEMLGTAAVEQLARGGAGDLKRAVRAHERLFPLLSDPAAAAGIEWVVRGRGMRPDNVLKTIEGVPDVSLRDLMRVLGDPAWTDRSMGPEKIIALGRRTDEVRFIGRFGVDAWKELRGSKNKRSFPTLLAVLPHLDEATAAKLVQDMMGLTPVKREAQLRDLIKDTPTLSEQGLEVAERPAPRRPGRHVHTALEDRYLEEARAWMTPERRKHLKRQDEEGVEDAILAHARLQQIKDRVESNWAEHQKLPYATRLRILDDIDDVGRQGGLFQTWISNLRGAVAERLFAPGGGLRQKRIENPLHPAVDKEGKETTGYTRLDGFYDPLTNKRPGSTSAKKEWVEIKSDDIGMPGRAGQPNATAVAIARRYAAAGLQDWHALLAHYGTRDDGIVIHFSKKPADAATQEAMLKELFAPGSPFSAVGFGDVWHERPAGRALPPKPPQLEDGPIRGVPVAAGGSSGG